MANLVINTGETLNADNYGFGSGPNQLWAVLEPAGGNQSYLRLTWFVRTPLGPGE